MSMHIPIRTAALLAVPLLSAVIMWADAPAQTAALPSCGTAAAPSSLDYVILASLADSSNVVGMAAYTKP